MFWHNFKYTLKTLSRNRMLLFWTFAFPILLGGLFKIAFSKIDSAESFGPVKISVVNSTDFQDSGIFKTVIENLSDENKDDRIFDTKYITRKESEDALEKSEIDGFVDFENGEPKVFVAHSGTNQTILRSAVDQIQSYTRIAEDVAEDKVKQKTKAGVENINPEDIALEVMADINDAQVKTKDVSPKNLSYTTIEYFTLIAMTCLYGGIISMTVVNSQMPNMHAVGKRSSISPTPKLTILLGSLLAGLVVQVIGITVLMLFMFFVFQIDFGATLPPILILSAAGSLCGLSIGVIVATLVKASENAKTGILIAISMAGSFFSGMMGVMMKHTIDTNLPILNKINPAAMITDGFYALYAGGDMNRFALNVASLCVCSGVLLAISIVVLRRQKYGSL